jgi:hypothetical protein
MLSVLFEVIRILHVAESLPTEAHAPAEESYLPLNSLAARALLSIHQRNSSRWTGIEDRHGSQMPRTPYPLPYP